MYPLLPIKLLVPLCNAALNLRGNRASESGLNALYHAVKVSPCALNNIIPVIITNNNNEQINKLIDRKVGIL